MSNTLTQDQQVAMLFQQAIAAAQGQNAPQELSFEQKVDMFRALATDPQAVTDYAVSRAEVILPLLDEQSTVRAIFTPERLAPGATPVYDVPFEDVDCVFMMPQIGAVPFVQVEGAQLHVSTFGLHGGVEWQIDVAADGRFQVGERATRMLLNKFIAQEELAGWSLIKAHAAALPAAQQIQALQNDGTDGGAGTGKMNIHTLNEVITTADELGEGSRRVADIYITPRRFNDLRAQLTVSALPESIREQLWANGQGNSSPADIRIHKVYNTNLVADDKGYAFTQRDGVTYGVMPIRDELSTGPNPIAALEHKIGVMGRERLGFGVLDDKGLIEITF